MLALWRELVAVAFRSLPRPYLEPSQFIYLSTLVSGSKVRHMASLGSADSAAQRWRGWYAQHVYMGPGVLPATEQKEKYAWAYHRKAYEHQSEIGYKDVCNL